MNKPRGRRPGSPDTRSAILDAARVAFVEHGYQGATLRRIASDAGVDIRLIAHHFGSKKGLFAAAMTLPLSPSEALERALSGPPESWATGILTAALRAWDVPETGQPLLRLLQSALTDPEQRPALAGFAERELVDRIEERLDGPHARRRASAAATLVAGMIVSRYVLEVAPLSTMSEREVVATLRPLLQTALHPPRRPGPPGVMNSPAQR